jgi:NAD(P)-dependent dehydrogenase (short-subunit alcohol dehydrogenase family)
MPTALITGSSRRIGRALALCLARRGHDIALHVHTARQDAETTAADIAAYGRQCLILPADLANPEAAAGLLPRAMALTGRVDVLVHNAAPFVSDRLVNLTLDGWHQHRAVILDAAILLTQAWARQDFAPAGEMMTSGSMASGFISSGLMVSLLDSKLGRPTPDFLSYTLAKAGLATFTQLMAQELAPRIRVNAIAPGPTLPAPTQRQAHFDAMRATSPLGLGAEPADLCRVLELFLDTPAMTGQVIAVDGGAGVV